MKVQLLRSPDRIIGIAVTFRKRDDVIPSLLRIQAPPQDSNFWRICDACSANEAMVFCRSHARYLCEFCLALHNNQPIFCEYLSMSAAREMLVQHIKNEAHT